MNSEEWKKFLLDWSNRVAAQNLEEYAGEARTVHSKYGFGASGATEAAIAETEAKLHTKLPKSYREFLKASNGLVQPVHQMASTGGDYLPVQEIDWFRVENQSWIDAWTAGRSEAEISDEEYFVYGADQDSCTFREAYLRTALAISPEGVGF